MVPANVIYYQPLSRAGQPTRDDQYAGKGCVTSSRIQLLSK
jgi:hypothetical protein